jgi:hypothetical protein
MRWRWVIRTVAVIGLIVVGIPVLLFSYVLLRYSDSKADVRRVIDSLTPEDKALPPGASRIFRVPLWRGNRDAIVNRMIIYKIHPNAMSQSAWHMRSLCALMVMPWRATEEERNALMWRELYFAMRDTV